MDHDRERPRLAARREGAVHLLQLAQARAFEAAGRLTYLHHAQGEFLLDLSLAALELALGDRRSERAKTIEPTSKAVSAVLARSAARSDRPTPRATRAKPSNAIRAAPEKPSSRAASSRRSRSSRRLASMVDERSAQPPQTGASRTKSAMTVWVRWGVRLHMPLV